MGALPGSTSFPPYSWDQLWKIKDTKKTNKMKSKMQKESADEETSTAGYVEARVILTQVKCRSRAESDCSSIAEEAPKTRPAAKVSRRNSFDSVCVDKSETPGPGSLEAVAKERRELEKFLFEESNKINRVAIKFILEKMGGNGNTAPKYHYGK
ncbi:hypothetical protein K0M31_001845 [Melipona bicolor]|uniref:Uncharacterized protein n=1 Tax=Melipona bicolor TaxID=60889 RepID=A0AA40GGG3_9HYME|nr:hypothetical protein K0M31_001845 [Melipona bicolor]